MSKSFKFSWFSGQDFKTAELVGDIKFVPMFTILGGQPEAHILRATNMILVCRMYDSIRFRKTIGKRPKRCPSLNRVIFASNAYISIYYSTLHPCGRLGTSAAYKCIYNTVNMYVDIGIQYR